MGRKKALICTPLLWLKTDGPLRPCQRNEDVDTGCVQQDQRTPILSVKAEGMSDCLHVSGRFLRTTGCCAEEEVVFCVMYCTTQSSYCTGGHMERILRTIQTEVTQLGIITTCALTARFKFCAWHILHLAPAHLSSVIKNGILVNTSSDGLDAG